MDQARGGGQQPSNGRVRVVVQVALVSVPVRTLAKVGRIPEGCIFPAGNRLMIWGLVLMLKDERKVGGASSLLPVPLKGPTLHYHGSIISSRFHSHLAHVVNFPLITRLGFAIPISAHSFWRKSHVPR